MSSYGVKTLVLKREAETAIELSDLEVTKSVLIDNRQFIEEIRESGEPFVRYLTNPYSRSFEIHWNPRLLETLAQIEEVYGWEGEFRAWPTPASSCFRGVVKDPSEWPKRFGLGARLAKWDFITKCEGNLVQETCPVAWTTAAESTSYTWDSGLTTAVKCEDQDAQPKTVIVFDTREADGKIEWFTQQDITPAADQQRTSINLFVRYAKYPRMSIPINLFYRHTPSKIEQLVESEHVWKVWPAFDDCPDLYYFGFFLPERRREYAQGYRKARLIVPVRFYANRAEETEALAYSWTITTGNDFRGTGEEDIYYEDVTPVDGAGGVDDEDGYLQCADSSTDIAPFRAHTTLEKQAQQLVRVGDDLVGLFGTSTIGNSNGGIQGFLWDADAEAWGVSPLANTMGSTSWEWGSTWPKVAWTDTTGYVIHTGYIGPSSSYAALAEVTTTTISLLYSHATNRTFSILYTSGGTLLIAGNRDDGAHRHPVVWEWDIGGGSLNELYVGGEQSTNWRTGCFGLMEFQGAVYVGERDFGNGWRILKSTDDFASAPSQVYPGAGLRTPDDETLMHGGCNTTRIAYCGDDLVYSDNGASWTDENTNFASAHAPESLVYPISGTTGWVLPRRDATGWLKYFPINAGWTGVDSGLQYGDNPDPAEFNAPWRNYAPCVYTPNLGHFTGGTLNVGGTLYASFWGFAITGNGYWVCTHDAGATVLWNAFASTIVNTEGTVYLRARASDNLDLLKSPNDVSGDEWLYGLTFTRITVDGNGDATLDLRGRYIQFYIDPDGCDATSNVEECVLSGLLLP